MKPPKKWKPGDERIITFMGFEDAVKAGRVVFVKRFFHWKGRLREAILPEPTRERQVRFPDALPSGG